MTGSGDGPTERPESWRFDGFTVETATFRLLHDGVPQHIEPRALEVLIYLIARRDRVVSKQEILDAIWKETSVTDNALTRAVTQIRKVLGDDLESPRYILTVPTKGYRFIGEVAESALALIAPAPPPEIRPSAKPVVAPVAPGARQRRPVVRVLAILIVAMISSVVINLKHARRGKFILGPGGKQTIEKGVVDGPSIVARPLAPETRVQSYPTFSADGRALAYCADVDGTPHLFRMPLDGGEATQITSGTDGETQPAWSPDGTSIAYVNARRGGIWIVAATGGEPRQVTDFGSRPSWSADGREISFQSAGAVDYGVAVDAQPPSTIWIVNVETKRAAPLTAPGVPAGGHGAPSWRRDGKRIVFSSCEIERCDIYSVARDGSSLTSLITDTRRLVSPVYARDGGAVHYVLVRYTDSILLTLPIDADGKRAGDPRRLRHAADGVMHHLAVSPDGFRFAWSLIEETSDLQSISINGGATTSVTRSAYPRNTYPAISGDGTKVAWCAAAAGEDSGVWVADVDGRNAKALAVGPGLKQHTQWSRSGWEVFYAAWDHQPTLFQSSLITGKSTVVARFPKGGSAPMISPDQSHLAFMRTIEGKTSIWIQSINGSGLRRLMPDDHLARFPVWSPSGRQLAVQMRRRDGWSVMATIPREGGTPRVVLATPEENQPYSWSADEQALAFSGKRDGVWNIWTVPVSGGEPRRVTENKSPIGVIRSPAWSPRGDRIIFESSRPRSNVWVSEARAAMNDSR